MQVHVRGRESIANVRAELLMIPFRSSLQSLTQIIARSPAQLSEDFDEDPGHDDEWAEFEEYLGGLPDEEYWAFMSRGGIDFLVRLSPPEGAAAEPACNAHGWFPIETGARKPERFPLGISFEAKAGEAG